MKLCWLGIHKWSRWKEYEYYYTIYPRKGLFGPLDGSKVQASDTRQKRVCENCGKVQDELVI